MLLSTACMLAGSYFLKPLINDYILPGDFEGLARSLVILAAIYLVGAAALLRAEPADGPGGPTHDQRPAPRPVRQAPDLAPALLRQPSSRRADESIHERH